MVRKRDLPCFRKQHYRTEYEARAAAKLRPHHVGLRPYQCPLCNTWHLTHHAIDWKKIRT